MSSTPRTTSSGPGDGGGGAQVVAGGVVALAATMLLISGCLAILRGIMGIAEDQVFTAPRDYVFRFTLAGWGWIHLVLGVLAVLVAVGLFRLARWARILGVGIAALLIIANFLSLPYYPLWSVTLMAVAVLAIWGICTVRSDAG
jgi:hypothetical protein